MTALNFSESLAWVLVWGDILALDSGVDITGETAGRYHGAAERTRGRGD